MSLIDEPMNFHQKKKIYTSCVFLYMTFIHQSIIYVEQKKWICIKKDNNVSLQKNINLISIASMRLWCIKNHSISYLNEICPVKLWVTSTDTLLMYNCIIEKEPYA